MDDSSKSTHYSLPTTHYFEHCYSHCLCNRGHDLYSPAGESIGGDILRFSFSHRLLAQCMGGVSTSRVAGSSPMGAEEYADAKIFIFDSGICTGLFALKLFAGG